MTRLSKVDSSYTPTDSSVSRNVSGQLPSQEGRHERRPPADRYDESRPAARKWSCADEDPPFDGGGGVLLGGRGDHVTPGSVSSSSMQAAPNRPDCSQAPSPDGAEARARRVVGRS